MPFIFYSNLDETLNNLVFEKNIWGVKTRRVRPSLEHRPEDFKNGEKIIWYSSESNSFFGYSMIKNSEFFQSDQIGIEYSVFKLENANKFENPIIRTEEIFEKISPFNLFYNQYRVITPEIYHELINLAEAPIGEITEEIPEHTHNSIILTLLKIGKLLDCDVWVCNDLKNKIIEDQRLGDLSIPDLILPGLTDSTLRILKAIDVIWLRERSVIAGFEVEHSTPIYSGMLRFTDLFLEIPNFKIRAYIVAPDSRKNQVINQFNRNTFKNILDNEDKVSKIEVIYYSSLNLGNEIVNSVYKQGGQYKVKSFLDRCENAEWEDFLIQPE